MSVLERAASFIYGHARLLERRLFARLFERGSGQDVLAALRAYQNADGGFGHALEADLRAPTSQPIHVEVALTTLHEAGVRDDALTARACAFLEGLAKPAGAVPPALPSALQHSRADHWNGDWAVTPAVNPTAGIAGTLHALGVSHPWLERATEWSLRALEEETFASAHTLRCALTLLEHLPDRARADALFDRVARQLLSAEWFTVEVPIDKYTLTPLHFPSARGLFEAGVIEAHLDDLAARQRPDGGWPVFWEPPGPAAVCEWRGRWTLEALMALRAHGRI